MCNLSKSVEEKGIAKGREEGRVEGRVEDIEIGTLNAIKKLINNLGMTVEDAMNALTVPETDRIRFRKELNK